LIDLLLIDGHNDLPWAHREAFGLDLDRGDVPSHLHGLQTDLRRLTRGGGEGQFWSTYVPSTLSGPDAVTATLEQIDFVHRMVDRFDSLELALNADQAAGSPH
jgi:membrane dipeptidase